MQLNAEDGATANSSCAIPEVTDEKSEAYKAGYKNICEIGKERIAVQAQKSKKKNGLTAQNLDTGFRVLKLRHIQHEGSVLQARRGCASATFDNYASNIKRRKLRRFAVSGYA